MNQHVSVEQRMVRDGNEITWNHSEGETGARGGSEQGKN